MATSDPWILPAGIEEILPGEASRLESMRRAVLDHLALCGYELVVPPLIEYLESLLTGTGRDLDLQTFKLIDQMSGRMMGVRADMTPQVARIQARFIDDPGPVRLCYVGPTLFTLGDSFGGGREPLQLGAELFGCSEARGDLEVLELMVESLRLLGVADLHIDLGHVGVFRGLAAQCDLTTERETALFEALQRKSQADIAQVLDGESSTRKELFIALADMNGSADVIGEAMSFFAGAGEGVRAALDNLLQVAELVSARFPALPLHIDLSELRGYHYHTGVVFSAFAPESGRALANGGRYDGVGGAFGRARAATGFSLDLRRLLRAVPESNARAAKAVASPWPADPKLHAAISALRADGERVINILNNGDGEEIRHHCDRRLVQRDGTWIVESW